MNAKHMILIAAVLAVLIVAVPLATEDNNSDAMEKRDPNNGLLLTPDGMMNILIGNLMDQTPAEGTIDVITIEEIEYGETLAFCGDYDFNGGYYVLDSGATLDISLPISISADGTVFEFKAGSILASQGTPITMITEDSVLSIHGDVSYDAKLSIDKMDMNTGEAAVTASYNMLISKDTVIEMEGMTLTYSEQNASSELAATFSGNMGVIMSVMNGEIGIMDLINNGDIDIEVSIKEDTHIGIAYDKYSIVTDSFTDLTFNVDAVDTIKVTMDGDMNYSASGEGVSISTENKFDVNIDAAQLLALLQNPQGAEIADIVSAITSLINGTYESAVTVDVDTEYVVIDNMSINTAGSIDSEEITESYDVTLDALTVPPTYIGYLIAIEDVDYHSDSNSKWPDLEALISMYFTISNAPEFDPQIIDEEAIAQLLNALETELSVLDFAKLQAIIQEYTETLTFDWEALIQFLFTLEANADIDLNIGALDITDAKGATVVGMDNAAVCLKTSFVNGIPVATLTATADKLKQNDTYILGLDAKIELGNAVFTQTAMSIDLNATIKADRIGFDSGSDINNLNIVIDAVLRPQSFDAEITMTADDLVVSLPYDIIKATNNKLVLSVDDCGYDLIDIIGKILASGEASYLTADTITLTSDSYYKNEISIDDVKINALAERGLLLTATDFKETTTYRDGSVNNSTTTADTIKYTTSIDGVTKEFTGYKYVATNMDGTTLTVSGADVKMYGSTMIDPNSLNYGGGEITIAASSTSMTDIMLMADTDVKINLADTVSIQGIILYEGAIVNGKLISLWTLDYNNEIDLFNGTAVCDVCYTYNNGSFVSATLVPVNNTTVITAWTDGPEYTIVDGVATMVDLEGDLKVNADVASFNVYVDNTVYGTFEFGTIQYYSPEPRTGFTFLGLTDATGNTELANGSGEVAVIIDDKDMYFTSVWGAIAEAVKDTTVEVDATAVYADLSGADTGEYSFKLSNGIVASVNSDDVWDSFSFSAVEWNGKNSYAIESNAPLTLTIPYTGEGEPVVFHIDEYGREIQLESKTVIIDGQKYAVFETTSYSVYELRSGVESVTLDKTAASIGTDGTVTLKATVIPADATDADVVWTSSDTSVATVVDGVVTAVSVGTATITATAGAHSATCVITVCEPSCDDGDDSNMLMYVAIIVVVLLIIIIAVMFMRKKKA